MKILLIDLAGPEAPDFSRPLQEAIEQLGNYHVAWLQDVITKEGSELKYHITQSYDAVVLSGVPLNRSSESVVAQAKLCNWLKTTTLPVIGICAGMQIMSMVFGGRVQPQTAPEVGIMQTNILIDDPIFHTFDTSENFESYMMHSDEATVPDGFATLARTELNANSIMRHGQRPLYGLQFHPELHLDGHALLQNFASVALNHTKHDLPITVGQLFTDTPTFESAPLPA